MVSTVEQGMVCSGGWRRFREELSTSGLQGSRTWVTLGGQEMVGYSFLE